MAKKDFIQKLLASRKLECSPVAFLSKFLQGFFAGEISEEDFKKIFEGKSTQAKMYLVYMGKEAIEANQKVFRNEFRLADEINHVIYREDDEPLSGEEFKAALKKFIICYNKGSW